jgi:hypothetical protein
MEGWGFHPKAFLYFGTLTTAVKAGLDTVPIPYCAGEQKEVLWIDLRHGGFGIL